MSGVGEIKSMDNFKAQRAVYSELVLEMEKHLRRISIL
jgi:hypothetical protein